MDELIRQCGAYRISLRWFIMRDMAEALETERLCFTHPWTREEFIEFMRHRDQIGMVAEIEGKNRIVGHMPYKLGKRALCCENFAVHPEYQRLGIGSFMLDKLKSKLRPPERRRLLFPVSEANLDSQLWFKARGLRCVRVDRNYWPGSELAAYVFQFRVPSEAASVTESNNAQG